MWPFEDISESTASLATEGLFEKIAAGKITVRRDTQIARLVGGPAVELSDGGQIIGDIVLCTTVFRHDMPFLGAEVTQQVTDANGDCRPRSRA